jgi:uncharacterized membrane protein
MKQQAYLNTLKQSLDGLPAESVDDILSDYEQHFVDGMQAGRSEDEIGKALGDPRKIASEFKAMTHVDAFQQKRSFGNFGRMALALVGLAGFNLFMLPFMMIAPLLVLTVYLLSASALFGGSVIAGSGALDVDSVTLDGTGGSIAVVNFFTGETRESLRQQDMHVSFEVPPYAVVYRESAWTNMASAATARAPLSRRFRVLAGLLYAGLGLVLFLLGRKLGRLIWAGMRRYLHAQANLLRGTQRAHA